MPPDDFAMRKGTYVDGCRVGTKTKTAPWLVLPQVMKCEIISSIEYEEVMEALRKQRYPYTSLFITDTNPLDNAEGIQKHKSHFRLLMVNENAPIQTWGPVA